MPESGSPIVSSSCRSRLKLEGIDLANRGRKQLWNRIATFVQEYWRTAHTGHDPNDRNDDREIKKTVKNMRPDELDRLMCKVDGANRPNKRHDDSLESASFSWRRFSLIRRNARTLRYFQLDELIGVEVTINGLDSIETDLAPVIRRVDVDAELTGPEQKFIEGAIAKYGLLDLTYSCPNLQLSERDKGGVPLLRRLGLVGGEFVQDGFIVGMAFDFLQDFEEDARLNHPCIRVFLRQNDFVAPELDDPRMFRPVLSSSDIPVTFKITDACVANSSRVWIAKHFYL